MNKIDPFEIELLKSHVLQKSRAYLIAHPEIVLNKNEQRQLTAFIERRILGEPIAYLLSERSFWSLTLKVTKDVLIPRHETELLVESMLEILPEEEPLSILELGTGSGAIALSLAKERPNWIITATDISRDSLYIAKENAEKYQLKNINFLQSNWFDAIQGLCFHAIVSNPPYLAQDDPHLLLGDLRFEPRAALVSGKDGMEAINLIISQATAFLQDFGYLFLEHGCHQDKSVSNSLRLHGFREIATRNDLGKLPRMTYAKVAR